MAQSANRITEIENARDDRTEELSRQVDALRSDISSIASTLRQMGVERAEAAGDAARDRAHRVADSSREAAEEARRRVERAGESVSDSVRDRPLAALAIAAGIGFVAGLVSGRR